MTAQQNFLVGAAILGTLLGWLLYLSGCHTMQGIGQDISAAARPYVKQAQK